MASVWAAFTCYFVMMVVSYYYGQKYMPVKYDLKSIILYSGMAMGLYAVSLLLVIPSLFLSIAFKTALFSVFLVVLIKRDFPLSTIPGLNRFFK